MAQEQSSPGRTAEECVGVQKWLLTPFLSLLAFVSNNPIQRSDPDGRAIIAIGGASGWGDADFRALAQDLRQKENEYYKYYLIAPYKQGVTYISNPANTGGLIPVLAPDWGAAIEKLSGAVAEYRDYVREVRNKKDSCVCPEFLHIVGFSDGATTIAKAIRESGSAIELPQDTVGLVGLADLVRYDELTPNARDNKKLFVATIGPSCSSSHAIRSTKGGWRGYHILSDWKETEVPTNHLGIPKHGLTKQAFVGGMGESMSKLLKANKCRSLLEFRLF